MPYFWGYDPYIILVIPAFIFSLYAQFKVKGTFDKYSRYMNRSGFTGADTVREILRRNGLYDVQVEPARGILTDHYDPRKRVVRLSETVYSSASISAVGVAAHETGHAIQHKEHYGPLGLRSSLIPIAGIGSSAGPYLAIFGLLFRMDFLFSLGLILYSAAVVFYLITLPVEYNASKRAIGILEKEGMLLQDELVYVRKVLNAAAMTYVASAAVAIASLLRLLLLANGRRRD